MAADWRPFEEIPVNYTQGLHVLIALISQFMRNYQPGPIEVQQVACLHPTTGPPLPEKLTAFLDAGPPPVYFGFGSMTDPDPAATTRMLLSVVESIGCRALLSCGWAGLGDGALPE